MDDIENWNMALAYYKRIDDLLTLCTNKRMNGDGKNWFKGIQSLYVEVYPKMNDTQKEEMKKKLDELTNLVNEKRKTIPTHKYMDIELELRNILEKKGMLTPKRDTKGL